MSTYINTTDVFYDSREFAMFHGVSHDSVMGFIDKIRGNNRFKVYRFSVNKINRNTDGVAEFCLFGRKELTLLRKIMFGTNIVV